MLKNFLKISFNNSVVMMRLGNGLAVFCKSLQCEEWYKCSCTITDFIWGKTEKETRIKYSDRNSNTWTQ